MKIIILKNDGIGDLIVHLPLIKSIKEKTNGKIDLILNSKNFFLKKNLNIFNKIFYLNFDNSKLNKNNQRISNIDKSTLKKISNKNYDVAIILRSIINDENLKVINFINANRKFYYGYCSFKSEITNLKEINILKSWKKIELNKNLINEYIKSREFLKKIKVLKFSKKNFFKQTKTDLSKNITLNLSGEKLFTNTNILRILLDTILKNSNNKLIVFGKNFNKIQSRSIKNILNEYSKKKLLLNYFDKTNLLLSKKIIDSCGIYIGFDTGLSHYAIAKNKKSLIILSSGSDCRFYPYANHQKKNDSYWLYITPCAGCNFVGSHTNCFFETRYCIDDIFIDEKKINQKFKDFLKTKNQLVNFAKNKNLISNWVEKNNPAKICLTYKKHFKISNDKFFYFSYFKQWLQFLFEKRLFIFIIKKILKKLTLKH